MKVVSMWSGGKDSCYACYRAIQDGYEIVALLNFLDPEHRRSLSHGLPADIIAFQAGVTGIECLQFCMQKDTYREKFKNIIEELKNSKDIKGIVFGDIYLQEHKDWIGEVCAELKVNAIIPLWGLDTNDILFHFIEDGFSAVVVSAKKEKGVEYLLGKKIDHSFINNLTEDIDACGEKGEFHTFVLSGPIFKQDINLSWGNKITEGEVCFLADYKIALQ